MLERTNGPEAATARGKTVLLVYQIGNSDLRFGQSGQGAEPKPIRIKPEEESFRDVTQGIIADFDEAREENRVIELTQYGRAAIPDGLRYVRSNNDVVAVEFPILPVVIHWLVGQRDGANILLWLIMTDQRTGSNPTGHEQDTIGMDCLFHAYLDRLRVPFPEFKRVQLGPHRSTHPVCRLGQATNPASLVTRTESFALIHCNPSDYHDLADVYDKLHQYLKEMSGRMEIYYAVGTGTPQMSFAGATAFGFDARVNFIYKPHIGKTGVEHVDEITHFRDLPRKRTLELLHKSLDAFNFTLAANILDDETGGYAPDDPPVRQALRQLDLLADWQRPLFADVVTWLDDATDTERAQLKGLVAYRLAETQKERPRDPKDRVIYWHTALIDALIRLRMWLLCEDIPAFVFGLDRFLDLAVTFGLTAMRPLVDWTNMQNQVPQHELEQLKATSTGATANTRLMPDRLRYLLWLIRSDPTQSLTAMVGPLLTLRLIIERQLAQYRHQYVHAVVTIDHAALDNFVESWGGSRSAKGLGGWVLLALAEVVVAALPSDPQRVLPDPDEFFREVAAIPEQLVQDYPLHVSQTFTPVAKPAAAGLAHWLSLARNQYALERQHCGDAVRQLVDETKRDLAADLGTVRPNLSLAIQRKLDQWFTRLHTVALKSEVQEALIEQYLISNPDEKVATSWMISALIRNLNPSWLFMPELEAWSTWRNSENNDGIRAQRAQQLLA